MISFVGPAKRLGDLDLPRIGAIVEVGEDEIHAVMDVEAGGSGFDKQNRPKMLFEPHVFYRNLSGAQREAAVNKGIAYPSWRKNYPLDSYPRLFDAISINETAALKSASWGLGQILGENYKAAGFDTPQAMVTAFVESEANQLEGMIRFIKANKLDAYLRVHNWPKFAEGYNGARYRENDYDGKLARSFAKWQKIKDTPFDPNRVLVSKPEPPIVVAAPIAPRPPAPPIPPPPPAKTEDPGFWTKFANLFRPKA